MISIDPSGLAAVASAAAAAGARAGAQTRAAVAKTTADITGTARATAPVDTGALRNSITGTVSVSGAAVEGTVGPSVHYGGYVELGTSRMAPQPYLFPALERHAAGFEAAMRAITGFGGA